MFSPSSLSHLSRFSAFSQKHVADKAAAPAPSAKPVPFAASPAEDGKVMGQGPFNLSYYLSGALAGGICCGLTHGALTPVDVVKTRIQLDPTTYNKGFIGGFKQVIEAEGAGALLTGLGPTAQGYFIQGWFKFGGVEFFKINITKSIGDQTAWDNRQKIYLVASAMAEFIADIFLCPYEACRIRLVSQPDYAASLPACAARMSSEMGFVNAFYSGFIPILFKQIPYTMAKFAVQGKAAEAIYGSMGSSPDKMSKGGQARAAPAVSRQFSERALMRRDSAPGAARSAPLGAARSRAARSRAARPALTRPAPPAADWRVARLGRDRRRRRRDHLAPGRHAALEDQQGGRRRRRPDVPAALEHRGRDGPRQAVHAGPRRPLRDDRHAHRRPVRHLRHRDGRGRRLQVPLPRPEEGALERARARQRRRGRPLVERGSGERQTGTPAGENSRGCACALSKLEAAKTAAATPLVKSSRTNGGPVWRAARALRREGRSWPRRTSR